jgi:transcriptional regulator with XRE-family HTH domain
MYQRIRDLREDNDLTQTQIANILNMSQTGYSQYEIGKNDIPTKILISLSNFYGTSVDYLLGLTDEIKPYKRSKIQKH